MSCHLQSDGQIELYFYGELPQDERARVQTHLSGCAECRQALNDLSVIRAALAGRPDVATPPGGDWSGFTARLSAAIAREERAAGVQRPQDDGATASIQRRAVPYLAAAAVLALVTFGVLAVIRGRSAPPVNSAASPAPAAAPASHRPLADGPRADAALAAVSDQHFERSKLVVLGLATKQGRHDDWSYEHDLATTLLSDTRLYRLAAEESGMQSLADTMGDLELVLLQTSMSAERNQASLHQLQRLIQRRDLLAKMDVVYTGH
jgi:hypothetical protein